MRFYDERGEILTIEDLLNEFEEIKTDGEHNGVTFEQYIKECTGKNGTLTIID